MVCDTAKDAYVLLLDNTLIVTCCKKRAEYLETIAHHKVELAYRIENSILPQPSCGMGCLKEKGDSP